MHARAFALNPNQFSSQSPEFSTIQDALKYLARGLRYGPILDAVHNGRRHDDVTLLGMWGSATVMVLRL